MILTAHQPTYLPWLGLFHKIALAEWYCIYDHVQYCKKDWYSRNQIKTNNGPLMLSVPVLTTKHREKMLCEIEIDNSKPWQRKHWRSIKMAYEKSPHFDLYADLFEDVYTKDWKYLTDLNDWLLHGLLYFLGLDPQICYSSILQLPENRNDAIIDMCKKMGGDTYIFGEMGESYVEVDKFHDAGIKVHFQHYKHPVYEQLHGDFVPGLSVIDLLFNHGKESLDIIMSGNIKDVN